MFILIAPYPTCQTTCILPSPDWGNSREPVSTLQVLKSISGVTYTYTKIKNKRYRYHWDFNISRYKAIELREFLRIYRNSQIKIIDHNNEVILGYIQNNPIELTGEALASNFPGNETMTVSIDFEETI